jgi:plastocyanin
MIALALTVLVGSGAVALSKTITVAIEHFAFSPAHIDVEPGDTVVFMNRDITPHTATAVDGSWTTGEILGGKTQAVSISEKAGSDYFCKYHPTMKGQLVIKK